jgi:hypothetical protein
MWFAEQLDSFINLGICKEYPNMARSKSTSGGKANPSNTGTSTNTITNKEQTIPSSPANIPDVKAVAAKTLAEEAATELKTNPEPRKLGVVKTKPRKEIALPKNLLPINLEEEIRRRAYELYLQRGPASGSEAEDWLNAEREVRQRYRQQQSA